MQRPPYPTRLHPSHRPLPSHQTLTDGRIVELASVVQVVAVQVLHGPQLVRAVVQAERLVPQLVPREVRRSVVEPRRAGGMDIPERALTAAQVVVDAEALLVRVERPQLAQEGQVLLGVLV